MVDRIRIAGGFFTAELDLSGLVPTTRGWIKKIQDAKQKALAAASRVGLLVFRRDTPHKYGKKLFKSWRSEIRHYANGSSTLWFRNPHLNQKTKYKLSGNNLLELLTKGSPSHVIEPRKDSGVLVVPASRTSDGIGFFSKRVHHPGTRANFFVDKAMDAAYSEAQRVLERELKKL